MKDLIIFLKRGIDNGLNVYVVIAIFVSISIFAVWTPFFLKLGPAKSTMKTKGFETVWRVTDGPLYAIAAKTLYRSDQLYKIHTFSPEYFAVHPPGYPMLIKAVSPFVGYLNSMLLVNFVGTIVLGWVLYYFFGKTLGLSEPLYLTFVTLLTPRMLISSSTGSSEIVFIICTLLAFILLDKKKFLTAGIFAAYASFTRVPGIFVGIAIFIYLLIHRQKLRENMSQVVTMLMSFAGLAAMCLFYLRQYGDPLAYFHSKAVIPTGVLYSAFFIGQMREWGIYIEDILFYFGIGWITLLGSSKRLPMLMRIYSWLMFAFLLTIGHREMSRFFLPLVPFLVAMQAQWLGKWYVKLTLILLIPAVYMYCIAFINGFTYNLGLP